MEQLKRNAVVAGVGVRLGPTGWGGGKREDEEEEKGEK